MEASDNRLQVSHPAYKDHQAVVGLFVGRDGVTQQSPSIGPMPMPQIEKADNRGAMEGGINKRMGGAFSRRRFWPSRTEMTSQIAACVIAAPRSW